MDDPTAVVGRRVVAHLLDVLLLTGLEAAVFFPVADKESSALPQPDSEANVWITLGDDRWVLNGDGALIYVLAVFVLWVVLYGVLQGRLGWTPGKLVCGVRVVREDGSVCGFWRSIGRTLLWVVDSFPYLIPYLTGFIVAMVSKTHQRVGDKAVGSFVVRASAMGARVGAVSGAAGAPAFEAGGGLSGGSAEPAAPAALPPAGWYPDPGGGLGQRWWDGSRWTEHTSG